MKNVILFFICFYVNALSAQDQSYKSIDLSITSLIDGTLLTPNDTNKPDLAIIIAGSGPTDRNGNQNFSKNNSLKHLAEALTNNGIATFRYDKRVVKQIKLGKIDKRIKFDDFVEDAIAVLNYFKDQGVYNRIYIVGHSQGSLIGMLASQHGADGFISLAGAGQNIGDVLIEQVTKTAPQFEEDTRRVVEKLKKGKSAKDYPPALESIFNSDIQPFMINWMSYYPIKELKKLDIPILLINGTKDLQVSVKEAELLKAANDRAQLKIVENMNHVLFIFEGSDLENFKSYNESWRPVSEELISSIISFINN